MTPFAIVLAAGDWRDLAACANKPFDLFFPEGSETSPAFIRQAEEAVAVCAGCLVRTECLDFAMKTRQRHGVWGGTSDAERRSVRPALTRGTS